MRIATRPVRLALGAVVVALLGARPVRAGDVYAKQMEAKAASAVIVKAVLKTSFGSDEHESNYEAAGTLVDASGLVMIQGFGFGGSRMKVNATKLRVLFDGEEKEYDAVLGATDSKLGLAFVRVKDLGDKKVTPIDFASPAEPAVGDELFGVLRTDSSFDYAPYYGTTKVVGQVKKPREMWLVSGFLPIGAPLYAADGKTAGVVIRQSGISEEGGATRVFLLPMKAFGAVVTQAAKAAQKALDDAKAKEKEAAEAAATEEKKPDETKPGEPGMGDAPGMGDEPKAPDAPKVPETPKDTPKDAGMGEAK